MKVIWVTSWSRQCGIADYSKVLWPRVQAELQRHGIEGEIVSLDEYCTRKALQKKLVALKPDLIHFQHEYGLFGGKTPPFYWFPRLVHFLKKQIPQCRLTATAHTVLSANYRFPIKGRGLEIPFRLFANSFLSGVLNNLWSKGTWGSLDGVMVHSRHQIDAVERSGCQKTRVIPHFVQIPPLTGTVRRNSVGDQKTVLVFGFFTPEKGQDIAIKAFSRLPSNARLILAGSVRRKKDQFYFDSCMSLAKKLGVRGRIQLTGFVEGAAMNELYCVADLVLAPFRETSGSGSLAHALGRRATILASDLPLNLEIAEREKNALTFFKSEDPEDCAHQMMQLFKNLPAMRELQEGAGQYALKVGPEKIAEIMVSNLYGIQD